MTETGADRGGRFRTWLRVVVAVIIVIVAMYAWKEAAVRSQRRTAVRNLVLRTDSMLRLAAVPLGWAVRAQLLAGNKGEVEAYLRRFVQEPGVTRAALVNTQGSVDLTTDPKLERQLASSAFPGLDIRSNEAVVKSDVEEILVSVPIMGYDQRLGTLIVGYSPPRGRRD